MKKMSFWTVVLAVLALTGCQNRQEMKLKEIIQHTESQARPILKEANLAYWQGAVNGDAEAFDRYANLNMQLTELLSDQETFATLKQLKENGGIKDASLARQLDILYPMYLENQADTALLNLISQKEAALELKYAEYRAQYHGRAINDNEVEQLLSNLTDSRELEAVWTAHKALGRVVADDVLEVVRLRNQVARQLGFDNYHTMSLTLSGQDPAEISALFDELDDMTRDGFKALKDEMDAAFAKRCHVRVDELRPWHFQDRFFQEAPVLYPIDLDKYYRGQSLEQLTTDFYASLGIDIKAIMANSDLYPKENKNQHAFCTDIDSEGDVRILCNITDNEQWMNTMLHEFGHGVYALGHDQQPVWLYREAAHTFTTEAIAMMFEKQSRNPEWMQKRFGFSDEEKQVIAENCFRSLRLQQLVFSRWTQVVYRFEKAMYADPEQDLNAVWKELVGKYQLLSYPEGRNEPDWAAKIHIALYPCYYHNYQLGALLASQIHHYITANITGRNDMKFDDYSVNPTAIGQWLQDNIFRPGRQYPWNEMIERATGEKLTAKYYKMQFVD